jgi:hypothetical protein
MPTANHLYPKPRIYRYAPHKVTRSAACCVKDEGRISKEPRAIDISKPTASV